MFGEIKHFSLAEPYFFARRQLINSSLIVAWTKVIDSVYHINILNPAKIDGIVIYVLKA